MHQDPELTGRIQEAAFVIQARSPVRPRICVVLGSGLGDFANELTSSSVIPSPEVPHYPQSTVSGHAGRILLGVLRSGRRQSPPLIVYQGRVHYYETGTLSSVLFPIQLARALGARTLFVTNAAGGINRSFRPGDLMSIRDCLSLSFLTVPPPDLPHKRHPGSFEYRDGGQNLARNLCDKEIRGVIALQARQLGIPLRSGTYCWLQGPSYETAAEIEMLRRMGVDAVGMSTVPELVMARQIGMKAAGISLISNLATGITGEKLSHAEVTTTARGAQESFTRLLRAILLHLT